MVWIGRGVQIIRNPHAGHLQVFDALFSQVLFGALLSVVGRRFLDLDFRHLRFDVLAFPTSGHAYIVSQTAQATQF